MKHKLGILILVILCGLTRLDSAFAQIGTAFTYQGRLLTTNGPANGLYDLQFSLYDVNSGGSALYGPVTNNGVFVTNGLFTVLIDFGSVFSNSTAYWLQIGVRTNGIASFTALGPRQELTPIPYANTAENLNGTLLASQLTGTLPAAVLSGTYGNGLTLNNPGNIFDGTFVGNGTGLTGVALLTGGNLFTGNQTIDGMLNINDGSGATNFTDVTIGPGGYYPGEEHSVNFDDGAGHVGSLIVGYNGSDGYFSAGNLYTAGTHETGTKSFTVFGNGNVNIDPENWNAGFLNNGSTNGAGLTFGSGSGEGIASKRTAGGNQYGLDFYTGFADRMSIANNGTVQFNNDMYLLSSTSGLGHRSSVAGVNVGPGGNGPFLWGFEGGALGTVSPDAVALTWDWHDNVTVQGEFLVVNGLTPVYAYLGDDGAGNDVQIGSQKSGVTALAAFNTADNAYMHFYCSSITIEGGADLAEPFNISNPTKTIPDGAVVVIDAQHPGQLKISDRPYDTRVAGVVSGANGVNPGIQLKQRGVLDGGKNVALTGRVYVLADASNGAIHPGDMLTTSSQPGYAMKVTDHVRATGAILGKAMTSLSRGRGMVLVLVTLQ